MTSLRFPHRSITHSLLGKAIALLRGQYAVGMVEIRIVQSKS
ncbi:MAG: hypothetical protein WBM44_17520 [Waterburya sp.]